MCQIRLLDCTLSDGGHVNNWCFGEDSITDIINKLEQSKVDIIEIGVLKNEPFDNDRTVFCSTDRIKQLLIEKKESVEYAIACEDVDSFPLSLLNPAERDCLDIIRVVIEKSKYDKDGIEVDVLEKGFAYCKGVVDRGYRLCVQPVHVNQYSDDEFVDMVRKFSALNPLALYVVDDWGTENVDSLLHYMHLADRNMPKDIMLGYHGHNNMMQVQSVAQAITKEEFSRDIVLDASVYGIDSGAGNLNLEIIAHYLNESCGSKYESAPLLDIFSDYVARFYYTKAWGYSAVGYLTAKYGCDPTYACYFSDIPIKELKGILEYLVNERKTVFTISNATDAKTANKKSFAIVIPTCNRHQAIDYWLSISVKGLNANGIDVVVFDSSSDEKTKAVVFNYLSDGLDNLRYVHYDGTYDGFSIDTKVMDAYRMFSVEYDYLWVHRDGLIIIPDTASKIINKLIDSEADFAVVNTTCREPMGKIENEYTDCELLFIEQCVQMTVLGATIVKSSFINSVLSEIPLERERNYGLYQPIAFFEYISSHRFLAKHYVDDIWTNNPAGANQSFWSGNTIKQWGKLWYENISNLPCCYDMQKERVLKVSMVDFYPFSAKNLLKIRAGKGLKRSEINEIRDIIPLISDTPIEAFYLISFIPSSIARFIVQHEGSIFVKIIQQFYFIFRGIVSNDTEVEC